MMVLNVHAHTMLMICDLLSSSIVLVLSDVARGRMTPNAGNLSKFFTSDLVCSFYQNVITADMLYEYSSESIQSIASNEVPGTVLVAQLARIRFPLRIEAFVKRASHSPCENCSWSHCSALLCHK
jgi:hypothetical protein